jgi:hypothetical protein
MHARTRELLEFLDAERQRLRTVVDAVPADRREEPPAPGRWSAAGIIEHLAIVETRVGERLAPAIADARAKGAPRETAADPVLPSTGLARVIDRSTRVHAPEAAHPTGRPFAAAWAALEQAGQRVRELVREADGLALGELTAPHPLFGPLSFYQWFAFIGAHEARHAAQIREDFGVDG